MIEVLGVQIEPIALTTSLYRLRKHHACESRYKHLKDKLGPDYGDKAQINVLTILEHNGVDDALWALCAVEQDCEQIARLMAADFAESVLHFYEAQYPDDDRPRKAIFATRAFAVGKVDAAAWDTARDAAWAAARDAAAAWAAARDTARDAAWDTARDAAWAAARDAAAAWAAARDAAWDAARDAARAAARDAQAEIMRRYLAASVTDDQLSERAIAHE